MKKPKKADLPTKICVACKRPFTWRKKWERCWDEVLYCSEGCKKKKKLAFTNFIMGYGPLSGAFKPTNSCTPFYEVLLTNPTINALSP